MSSILIKNGTVVTLGENNKVLHGHDLLIENDRITKIGKNIEAKADKTINAHGKLVMPGFINAHMHFYSTMVRGLGKAAPSANFTEVLNNLWWRLDKKLTLDDCYYSTIIPLINAIQKGTTTLLDHHASPFAVTGSLNEIAKAGKESGLRVSTCYELSDRDGAKIAEEGIDENINFIKECRDKGDDQLHGMFGLHASFTIGEETMEKAADAAKSIGTGFHVHTAEDMADQVETKKMTGMSVVERFDKHGILGKDTICVHCVHVDDKEIDLLKESDTMVVHNPQSNMNNAVGVADIFKLQEKGILVGLGTDAMTVNMTEELRTAHWLHKLTRKDPCAGFMECINMLAINNAKIAERLFPGTGVGILAEGNKADVILIDYFTPTELSDNTFYGHLLFGIPHAPVDTTIANGKVLMENKIILHLDEEMIAAKAKELADKLWERF
ncbi:MAG: putative aminohydrolase SsnA [Bacteriovoracaceae bacterium]|nr:putative aminohydrolase SsnA [Bacteriovoracaceae bacterium]